MHALLWLALGSAVAAADPLPGSQPLTFDGDSAAAMVAGIHKYLDRELSIAAARSVAGPPSDAPNWRARLRTMLGVIDERVRPVEVELLATPSNPAQKGHTTQFRVYAVRWPVLPGV